MKKRQTVGRRRISPEAQKYVAENMKERIYATLTLLAVVVSLWQTAKEHSVIGAIASVAGTVFALWLATLVAVRMSHRTVHGKNLSARDGAKLAFTSSGLLLPAVMPVLLLLFSSSGLISMRAALMASIVVLLLSLVALSLAASRKIYDRPWQILLVSALELVIGVGVVALKIVAGE